MEYYSRSKNRDYGSECTDKSSKGKKIRDEEALVRRALRDLHENKIFGLMWSYQNASKWKA